MLITVELVKNYKALIKSDSPDVIDALYKYLSCREESVYYIFTKRGKIRREEMKTVYFTKRIGTLVLEMNQGLLDYLALFYKEQKEIFNLELNVDKAYFNSYCDVVLPKWEKVFLTNPKGESIGKMQLSDFNLLISKSRGIMELYTGYGKNEVIVALTEHHLHYKESNVLILACNNTVLGEINLRAKNYDVDTYNKDLSKRALAINPKGFMSTSKIKNKEQDIIDWLSKVELVITDECDAAQAKSYEKLFQLLPNVKHSFGLSASADSQEGNRLLPSSLPPSKLGSNRAQVVGLTGPSLVKRDLNVPVLLYVSKSRKFTDRVEYDKLEPTDWQGKIALAIRTESLAQYIAGFIKDQKKMFMIPVTNVEPGQVLAKNLYKYGINAVSWSGESFQFNGEVVETDDPVALLKQWSIEKKFDCLITTSVGFTGLDLKNMTGVIPLTGKNHRNIIQPIGRAARGDDVTMFIIFDKSNPKLNSHQDIRLDHVRGYFIIKSETIVR